ncbi:MAG: GDYXXLXY domain-containing protein [Actinobacteria bacterium]|nr:GDYXXLXY domain-containing protein [Actinomycetota bacterium]
MSRNRRLALLAIVCVQLALPLGLAGLAAADLAFGEEIRLRAQPVDPLDIFRGNYVVLRYDISSLQVVREVRRGGQLCADLFQSSADTYSARFAYPDPPPEGKTICGRARSDARGGESVGIEYGIETYYASADRAREIESSIGSGQAYAVLDLDDDGSARIERLEFDE